ncbi:MAG: hypothetical protein AAB576_08430 [Elusimicrobiota bacterium]
MIQLILMLSLSPALQAPVQTAAVKPCVFPNTCGAAQTRTITIAEFRPCVFPNRCGGSNG